MMKAISEDLDVQFYWTLMSQDIDHEEDAIELFTNVCYIWVTICGFQWLLLGWRNIRNYKRLKVAKKHGLRKIYTGK